MKCLLVFIYTCTHENIYTYTQLYRERGRAKRGEKEGRGEEELPSLSSSTPGYADTDLYFSAFQGTLSASDECNHISIKLVI